MCKHEFDSRYQKPEDKLYIAQLYFPLISQVSSFSSLRSAPKCSHNCQIWNYRAKFLFPLVISFLTVYELSLFSLFLVDKDMSLLCWMSYKGISLKADGEYYLLLVLKI